MLVLIVSFILFFLHVYGHQCIERPPKVVTSDWERSTFGIDESVFEPDKILEATFCILDPEEFNESIIANVRNRIKQKPKGCSEYIEYWNNGNIKLKVPFKDGKAHGHIHLYYDNGTDAYKGFFSNGIRQGVHIFFYKSETDSKEKKNCILNFDIDGRLDGEQKKCYRNGRLGFIIEYDNGRANGKCGAWRDSKEEIFIVEYRNNILKKKSLPMLRKETSKIRYQDVVSNKLINAFIKEAVGKFGVICQSFGGEQASDIKTFYVQFEVNEKGTIERAQELLVLLTEMFKDSINLNSEIRPYLREYPFPSSRVQVSLSFYDAKGNIRNDGSVATCFVTRNDDIYFGSQGSDPRSNKCIKKVQYKKALDTVLKKAENKSRSDFNKD